MISSFLNDISPNPEARLGETIVTQACANDIARDNDYSFNSTLNFWPPTVASYIRPPFACVNIAMPSTKFASADAPAVTATAEAWAPSS